MHRGFSNGTLSGWRQRPLPGWGQELVPSPVTPTRLEVGPLRATSRSGPFLRTATPREWGGWQGCWALRGLRVGRGTLPSWPSGGSRKFWSPPTSYGGTGGGSQPRFLYTPYSPGACTSQCDACMACLSSGKPCVGQSSWRLSQGPALGTWQGSQQPGPVQTWATTQ